MIHLDFIIIILKLVKFQTTLHDLIRSNGRVTRASLQRNNSAAQHYCKTFNYHDSISEVGKWKQQYCTAENEWQGTRETKIEKKK